MKIIVIDKKSIEVSGVNSVTYLLNLLLQTKSEDVLIQFEKDTYYFDTEYAYQDYIYMSNNDHSLKQIAIPIYGKRNIIIDGNGSSFIFIGRMLTFMVKDSKNIVLKNFSIDYKRPFFTQGEVIDSSPESVLIKVDKQSYSYKNKDGKLYFYGENYTSGYVFSLIEFEKEGRRPIDGVIDDYIEGELYGEEIEEGLIRIDHRFNQQAKIGSMLVIKHENRYVPAIAMSHTQNITIEDVHIKQAGAMGMIAQYCKDIVLQRVTVAVEEGSQRMVSTNADATHFVGCKGNILIENCRFENQLDDALNVHGNYLEVHKVIEDKKIIAKIGHGQQVGVFGMDQGDKLGIIHRDSMLEVGLVTLVQKELLNSTYVVLTFEERAPFVEGEQYCIENLEAYPTLTFRKNTVGKNRARGLLLTSRKQMIIEDNIIVAEGPAIKVSGDINSWFESGPIDTLIIRRNYIASINGDVWGKGMISIDPEMKELLENRYYHHSIVIEDNTIVLSDKPVIFGHAFKSLVLKNNKFITNVEHEIVQESEVPIEVKGYGSIEMSMLKL